MQHFLIAGLYKWLAQTAYNCFALWVAYSSPNSSFNFPQAVLWVLSNSLDTHGLAMLTIHCTILLQQIWSSFRNHIFRDVTLLLGERILTLQKNMVTSEDEGTMFFPNIRNHASNDRVSNHRRPGSSETTLWEPYVILLHFTLPTSHCSWSAEFPSTFLNPSTQRPNW
jgi:hypothetical protein